MNLIILIDNYLPGDDMQKNKLITVIGSSNFDIIIAVKNNPRPGESILAKDLVTDYGGKGATQAVTASKLGGNVRFLTCLGDDVFGKLVLDNFKDGKSKVLAKVSSQASISNFLA